MRKGDGLAAADALTDDRSALHGAGRRRTATLLARSA